MVDKTPGRNGFKYKPQYGIIVICSSEKEQQTLFKKLQKLGLKLRVATV